MKHIYIAMLLVVALLLSSCGSTAEPPATQTPVSQTAPTQDTSSAATATQPVSGSSDGKKIRIAYTVPTLNSAFFTTLGEGAQKAADDFGVELTFVGANLDVSTQVKQVDDFIQKGVDVLIIQGADSAGIVAAVNDAEKAGIPVVTTGDKPDGGKITTHIGFDNVESGVIGGDFISQQLSGKGKVVELIGRLGTASGREKSEGFRQALGKHPDMQIVASQPANFQRETAVSVMENIIQAQPEINAVYAANDDMALGALQALKAAGRDKGVVIVGNDGIDDAIAAVKSGEMAATNATPPYRQGYMGVQVAYRIAAKQSVPSLLKEKNELITKDNVDQAETIMKGVDPANRYWEAQFDASTSAPAATATTASSGSTSGKKVRIAYTVPTLNSAFFTTLGEGAQKAADDFGVELTFVGANLDVSTQVKQVDDFIQKGVDVLVIQGADSAGIVAAVNDAEKAGIPVVTTGDKPDGGKITTHIGFDNVESGVIGADFIGKALNGKGKVVELIGRLGTASGREKSEGLKQGLAKYPDIQIVSSQPANFQRETAVSVMENIIQAQPEINAVYAANDDMALGALQALKAAGRDKGVVIMGNDGIDDAIAAVKSGEMAATNATPPYRQGYMGVQVAYRIATGQPVPALLKEKNEPITKDNVDQAETIMKGVDPANRYWEAQFPK